MPTTYVKIYARRYYPSHNPAKAPNSSEGHANTGYNSSQNQKPKGKEKGDNKKERILETPRDARHGSNSHNSIPIILSFLPASPSYFSYVFSIVFLPAAIRWA